MSQFSQDQIDKMKRYEAAKIAIKEHEAVIDELKEEIASFIPEGSEVESEHGKFYLQTKEKFTYSESTQRIAADLKEAQAREKADGTATSDKTFILMFSQKKT